LQQLPEPEPGKTPRFVFYATNLQSGASVRLGRNYLADYKVGRIDKPNFALAKVVAASSAFPPALSPEIRARGYITEGARDCRRESETPLFPVSRACSILCPHRVRICP
jgi:hypothetical protein